jgi:hypothetical protein
VATKTPQRKPTEQVLDMNWTCDPAQMHWKVQVSQERALTAIRRLTQAA